MCDNCKRAAKDLLAELKLADADGDNDLNIVDFSKDPQASFNTMLRRFLRTDRQEIVGKMIEVAESLKPPKEDIEKLAKEEGISVEATQEKMDAMNSAIRSYVAAVGLMIMGKPYPEVGVFAGTGKEISEMFKGVGRGDN